jgi:hypothetical protein
MSAAKSLREGLLPLYVVRVQTAGGADEDAYQFDDADEAFDMCDLLARNGRAVHVVRRWRHL